MSRMNAPWANPEQFGDALPEFLRSPMTLAMGASILAHGIFFLGLPIVANPGDSQDIRPVNVVQLTPQDQAQVPAIAQQPQQPSSLIPNPLSPNGLLTPPIPVSPNPSLNSTPFDFSGLSGGPTSQPSYSSPSNNYNDSYYQNPTRVAETEKPRSDSEKEQLNKRLNPSPNSSPSPSPSPSLSPSPSPSTGASPSPSPILKVVKPTPTPSSSPTPSETPPQKLAAANSPEERAKNQALYQFDDGRQVGSAASSDVGVSRYAVWRGKPEVNATLVSLGTQNEERPPQAISISYPEDLILLRGAKASTLGLLIGKNGKVIGQPELIGGGGYGKLDAELIKRVKEMSFPTSDRNRAVLLKVKFEEPGPPVPQPTPPS